MRYDRIEENTNPNNSKIQTGLVWLFLLISSISLFPLQGIANEENRDGTESNRPHVKVEMLQEEETISPGHPFWVAIHLTIEPEWHVYWKNPGDAGVPIKVEWTLPPGFEASPLEWPVPEKFSFEDLIGFGYDNEVTLLTQLTPPTELPANTAIPLGAKVSWLVCSPSSCQPGEATVELPLTMRDEAAKVNGLTTSLFAKAKEKIPLKNLRLTSTRKDGFIQLELPEVENLTEENTSTIYFFPEEQDQIDLSAPQTISQEKGSNRRFLNLKESSDGENQQGSLKGILIFPLRNEHKVEAIAVDSLIESPNGGELSLASPPVRKTQSVVANTPSETDSSDHSFEGGLALALGFAFIGGIILNLMPCVLPVMSFKVMGFMKMAGQSRSLTFRHGLVFSLGVIVSFWILASAILSLRAYGEVVGWGFQLQHPLFVIILATLLFVFALSLFGLFEWGMFLSSWAGERQVRHKNSSSSEGYASSFFSGVLATAVATPCTGPFLGSAVGFALTLPSFQALLIFTSLGLGMSSPYLLLARYPSCLKFLPRPGPWMETFKQLMGFVLMTTVLWLVWVFSAQTNSFSIVCLLAGLLLLSIGCWIYGKGCVPSITKKKRILAFALVALFGFLGVKSMLLPSDTWDIEDAVAKETNSLSGWQNFSPALVAQLKQEGKPLLIDFTAKWCLICQTNHLVLNSGEVAKSLDKAGVVRVKADWTKNDPAITEELRKFGRNSVPLYVLYKPGETKATILPQVLTPDVVLSYLADTDSESKEEIALNE